MGLNTLGVLDISVVTDVLTKMLGQCYDQSPMWTVNGGDIQKFTLEISGSAPDAVRSLSHCQLSLYLFHVSQDPYQRNSPVLGPRARTIPAQPLSPRSLLFAQCVLSERLPPGATGDEHRAEMLP